MRNFAAAPVALLACLGIFAQDIPVKVPQATRLEPKTAKPGTVVTITGVGLGKARVEEVFLTDHRFDLKVKVLEQSDLLLKIRIPPFVKAGRHQLLLLTAGQNPSYLEQPVYLLVEAEEDAGEKPGKP